MFKINYKGENGWFISTTEKEELDKILILISNSGNGDGAE